MTRLIIALIIIATLGITTTNAQAMSSPYDYRPRSYDTISPCTPRRYRKAKRHYKKLSKWNNDSSFFSLSFGSGYQPTTTYITTPSYRSYNRTYIPGHYETRTTKIWIQGKAQRVWVPAKYETRTRVEYIEVAVPARAAYYEERVIPAKYKKHISKTNEVYYTKVADEKIERTLIPAIPEGTTRTEKKEIKENIKIHDGYWTQSNAPGYYKDISEQVWVEGYYR